MCRCIVRARRIARSTRWVFILMFHDRNEQTNNHTRQEHFLTPTISHYPHHKPTNNSYKRQKKWFFLLLLHNSMDGMNWPNVFDSFCLPFSHMYTNWSKEFPINMKKPATESCRKWPKQQRKREEKRRNKKIHFDVLFVKVQN